MKSYRCETTVLAKEHELLMSSTPVLGMVQKVRRCAENWQFNLSINLFALLLD